MGKYRTIVIDPPWDHSDGTGVNVRSGLVPDLPYATMTVAEIGALPVRGLADNVDADAHLYLWTTSRYLPVSFPIVRQWGFEYVAPLVWCKPSRGFSVGGVFQSNVEFVLFCRLPAFRPAVLRVTMALADAADRAGVTRAEIDQATGTSDMAGWWLSRLEHRCACPTAEHWPILKRLLRLGDELDDLVAEINSRKGAAPVPTRARSRWFQWPRGIHSAKPEAFIDLVEQVSPGPYLEMFARRNRLGWDTWGNEALNHVELAGVSAGLGAAGAPRGAAPR